MTAPEPMTRTELMELAALDALGLLDEYEAALYTRSFHDAPAAVQNEIRELQAQIAAQLGELCDEEPSPELRDRVLQAVSKAIELDSPAPLASIGRGLNDYDPNYTSEARRRYSTREPVTAGRLAFSGQFWRAACFVLVGVVVVCVFGMVHVWRSHNELTMAAVSSNTHEQLEKQIGPTVKHYLQSRDTIRIVMTADDEDTCDCWANVMILEDSEHALLITEGLPELADGQTYQLRVRDENGKVTTIARVTAGTMLAGHRVIIEGGSLLANATWELTGPNGVMLIGGGQA